tara:strand:- start:33791 stop:34420 length:630 start_codon:yes stop_codon:yes gene_type:complete
MKKALIILLTVFLTQLTFGQSMDELLKMWNSETVRIGDSEKERIDSEIKDLKPIEKVLISTSYSNGKLKIYSHNQSIRKLDKTYTLSDTTFSESYYFMGRWPLYVEIEHSNQKSPDKFYFDKTNLMLWIDSNQDEFTVENEKCSKWWWNLAESMDKLMMIANSESGQVNEDEIKLPDPPPMSKEDSLKMIELKKQFDELMKTVPDSLKK